MIAVLRIPLRTLCPAKSVSWQCTHVCLSLAQRQSLYTTCFLGTGLAGAVCFVAVGPEQDSAAVFLGHAEISCFCLVQFIHVPLPSSAASRHRAAEPGVMVHSDWAQGMAMSCSWLPPFEHEAGGDFSPSPLLWVGG